MRILLITPSAAGGHHDEYKVLLAKAFYELGHEVLQFSPNNEKSKKIEQSVPTYANKSKYPSKIFKYLIRLWQIRHKALADWQVLFDHIQNLEKESKRPDLLFFEYFDSYIGQYLSKWDIENKLTIQFSGILFHPRDTRLMNKSFFRRVLFDPYHIFKSRWCRSIGVLMEESIPYLSALIHKPVIELPDVVSIPESIQDKSIGEFVRKRAGDRFIIGIWGAIDQRKGTSEFLQMQLELPPDKYFFVIGGRFHNKDSWPENDKYILNQTIENLLTIDEWLSDDELLSGMLSCDLIFAAYPDYRFSSGIIGKAAAVGVPILVNDGFVMAKQVKDYNIGFVKQEQTDVTRWVSDNIAIIKKLRSSSSFKEGCLKYCERYGYEQWRKSLAHLIEPQK